MPTAAIRSACLFALIAWLLPAGASAAPPLAKKSVLTVYAQARESAAITAFDQGLRQTLQAASGDGVTCYAEFVDTQRFSGDDFVAAFRDYLSRKYVSRPIDVVVLVGPAAARAVVQPRPLFPGVPMVFYTIDQSDMAVPEGAAGLIGTFGRDQQRSLELALTLHPDTQQVFVVVQTPPDAAPYERYARRALAPFESRVAMRYLSNLPTTEVIAALNAAPARSVVLYVQQTDMTAGGRSDPRDALALIERSVPLPIYGGLETYLGSGVVGGYLYSGQANGAAAGSLAWRIANGERLRGTVENDATVPIFDARRLHRWTIAESRLPAGSVVRFREPSFWARYRQYAIAALSIFAVQFGLIGMLLAQRRQRRRAEHAQRDSEARYRDVVQAQTDFVCRCLPDTTLTFVNEAYCRFLKKRPDELIGTRVLDLVPPARRESLARAFASVIGSAGTSRYEQTVLGADGRTACWVEWVNSPATGADGRITEILGTGRDITDRKRAEEALRTSEARTSALLRAMPDLMFVISRDGTYLDYHARDPRDLFVPPEQFIGKTVFDILPPTVSTRLGEAIASADQTGSAVVVEYALPMDDGERFFEARVVGAGDGQVLSIVREITEQKRAEARLRKSEDRYALATSAGGVGVWDWNMDADRVYVDPVVLKILGRSDQARSGGIDWRGLVHSSDHRMLRTAAADYLAGRSDKYDVEIRMGHEDGSLRWFQTRGTAIRRPDGRVYRMIGTFTDVTDRKRAQDTVVEREATLRASWLQIQDLAGRLLLAQETERKRLARELHDDLSQQFALISIEVDSLRPETPDFATRVQAILARVAEAATDVHHISHRLHPYKLEALGLVPAIQSVCDEMAAQCHLPVEFRHDAVPAWLPPDVALCLFRIVQEALHNVAKHSRAGRATVHLSADGSAVSLKIADSGAGFVTGQHEHTGLGLVSMRERVHVLGGQLAIHSAPGAGTRIGVLVPMSIVPSSDGAVPRESPAGSA